LIGTHGQTIFHEPKKKRTLQIGGDAHIAKATGLPLVCNFRMQDVLLGGNGAPLVPFGDHRLFGSYEAALNLGGFANVSIGNPLLKDGVQSAFDIAPANILFNPLAEKLGHPFDKNGAIAASGRINNTVLEALNRLDYYQELGPKSLGFEWVEENVSPLIAGLSPEEALRTLVEHLALQLQRSLGPKKTIVTGGGAFNSFLIQRCLDLGMALELPPSIVINYKEAIVFALLANERYHGRINVLGNTTGSGILHSSGSVFLP
jgi:anhydro-N-acetylmuramic acid kinase